MKPYGLVHVVVGILLQHSLVFLFNLPKLQAIVQGGYNGQTP